MYNAYYLEKQSDYLDYYQLKRSYDFANINANNLLEYLSKTESYVHEYQEKVYSYLLSKDFIHGLAFYIKKSEGTSAIQLENIEENIVELVKFILNSQFYTKENDIKKESLKEALDRIISVLSSNTLK